MHCIASVSNIPCLSKEDPAHQLMTKSFRNGISEYWHREYLKPSRAVSAQEQD